MTLPEVCALAYTLLVEKLDQYAVALFTVAGLANVMGGQAEAPDPDAIRADFDDALAAEPDQADPKTAALRRVLGLREV